MTQKPQLLYFDIRGRAEPIRLLLEEVGVTYEDVQINNDDWPARRGLTPFGRMPVYREGDLEIPETYAILNYLGRRHGLLGTDEQARIRCDVAIEAFRDLGQRMATVFGALTTLSEEARAAFIEKDLPEQIAMIEAYYVSNPNKNGYWAGSSLTIVDVAAFHSIEGIKNQFPKILERFEGLGAFLDSFAARPKIKAYLDSDRRPAALFYGPKGKIYPR